MQVLVDTSVWIDHFRNRNLQLGGLLNEGLVLSHPFVTGELACGSLKNRTEILSLMQVLPQAPLVNLDEFLCFIDNNSLASKGVGFVDINLLASASIRKCLIWTLDKKLNEIARELNIAF